VKGYWCSLIKGLINITVEVLSFSFDSDMEECCQHFLGFLSAWLDRKKEELGILVAPDQDGYCLINLMICCHGGGME
jgi:hypothetical protein